MSRLIFFSLFLLELLSTTSANNVANYSAPLCAIQALPWLAKHVNVSLSSLLTQFTSFTGTSISSNIMNKLEDVLNQSDINNDFNQAINDVASWWSDELNDNDWTADTLQHWLQGIDTSQIPICIWRNISTSWITTTPTLSQYEPGVWNLLWIDQQSQTTNLQPICGDGSPWGMLVRRGTGDITTQNKIVMEYGGGGACWTAETCNPQGENTKSILNMQTVLQLFLANLVGRFPYPNGHYDFNSPYNPNQGWSFIYAAYCTGDIWTGNNTMIYQLNPTTSFPIYHHGSINMNTSLTLLQHMIPTPQQIFITGCSAGGYGSLFAVPYINQIYPNVPMSHFSDSAVGMATINFLSIALVRWNAVLPPAAYQALPPILQSIHQNQNSITIPNDNIMNGTFIFTHMYMNMATKYPGIMFSQYSHNHDQTQIDFWVLTGVSNQIATQQFPYQIEQALQMIALNVPNFRYAITNGTQHCLYLQGTSWLDAVGVTVYNITHYNEYQNYTWDEDGMMNNININNNNKLYSETMPVYQWLNMIVNTSDPTNNNNNIRSDNNDNNNWPSIPNLEPLYGMNYTYSSTGNNGGGGVGSSSIFSSTGFPSSTGPIGDGTGTGGNGFNTAHIITSSPIISLAITICVYLMATHGL